MGEGSLVDVRPRAVAKCPDGGDKAGECDEVEEERTEADDDEDAGDEGRPEPRELLGHRVDGEGAPAVGRIEAIGEVAAQLARDEGRCGTDAERADGTEGEWGTDGDGSEQRGGAGHEAEAAGERRGSDEGDGEQGERADLAEGDECREAARGGVAKARTDDVGDRDGDEEVRDAIGGGEREPSSERATGRRAAFDHGSHPTGERTTRWAGQRSCDWMVGVALPLEQYGFVGDLHTGAMIGAEGSVAWLCVPRFDADACFASLLGDESNGTFRIAPSGPFESTQTYVEDTLVLETTFATRTGRAKVIDFMPIRERHARLVRIVEGISGEVSMEVTLTLRFDYGRSIPWVRRVARGHSFVVGPIAALLETPVELEGRNQRTVGSFVVHEGERVPFVLSFHDSVLPPPRRIDPQLELAGVVEWWRRWVATSQVRFGRYEPLARRSLITLKALTYAPTGGMVAALTTSLPEDPGGSRNWDYRFCWLRDAAFAVEAFLARGMLDEARAWRGWLLRAIAGDARQIQILYGVGGERRIPELELEWLPGYEGSRPVRVGNGAAGQFQMDVYGEVADVLWRMVRAGIRPDENAWEIQRYLTDFVVSSWREPDDGIWEIRGERQHFTHSKIMAWVAIDRGVKVAEAMGVEAPSAWHAARAQVHAAVLEEGWNESVGAFTQAFGSTRLDAAVLLAPLVGFIDPDDPRARRTAKTIARSLTKGGFVQRYEPTAGVDGIGEPEGAFLPCTFWLVQNLALQGEVDEAEVYFERASRAANALGIFSEEYEPTERRMLGNFAQAFTHVAMLHAAHALERAREARRDGERERQGA